MRKMLFAAVMGAGVLAGAPSFAQTPPPAPPGPRGAGPADADRDGVVTRAEAMAEADRRFAAIDANRDGKVSGDEMRAERERHMAARAARRGTPPQPGATPPAPPPPDRKMGKRVDPDRDGNVSRDEWRKRAGARFDRMDANHDGRIDANERGAMRDLRKMRRAGDAPPPPPPAPAPDTDD